MKNYSLLFTTLVCITSISFYACTKSSAPVVDLVKTINVKLAADNELPAPTNRNDNGTATLQLFSDNRLEYRIDVGIFDPTDKVTMAHIHTGDAGTNGPVAIGFDVSADATGNGRSFGSRIQLTQAQADALKSGSAMYVNVHSQKVPSGIMRGQVETEVLVAYNVGLFGNREVPPVNTTATGTAWVRLTADNNLYTNVNVTNVPSGDALTAAHIHTGAIGVNGPVLVNLLPAGVTDFGKTQKIAVTQTQVSSMVSNPLYVNAHSTRFPGGIVRGQMKP